MQVMSEPATRGREREREYAQISEREKLQSKFLLKFSYRKILSHFSAPLEKELVCEIKKIQDENPCDVTKSRDVIIINVSPIEIGHCLLVPSLEQNLPQILNEYSIRLALQVMASSGRSNFKMAFNSLCAYASVNHLHWHMYYLQVIHLWIIFKIYYKCLSA